MSAVNLDLSRVPLEDDEPQPAEEQALDALCHYVAVDSPPELICDGKIHRFATSASKSRNDKRGWYVFFADADFIAGAFGEWGGESTTWHSTSEREFSAEELIAHQKRMEELKTIREEALRRAYAEAAKACAEIWSSAADADPEHPYLKKKQVGAYGLKQTGDGRLIVPVYIGDDLASLQYITDDGGKQFHSGGRTQGGYTLIEANEPKTDAVYIVEGYATGASVHEATGAYTIIAFNAGNLAAVGQFVHDKLPDSRIIFVADNDDSNTGIDKANKAAELIGAEVIMPPRLSDNSRGTDANDYACAGNDLAALLIPRPKPHIISFAEFCAQARVVDYFIDRWVLREGRTMTYGDSGCGKTFEFMDEFVAVTCPKITTWHGYDVIQHACGLYLCGEGAAGIGGRFKAACANYGVTPEDCDAYILDEALYIDKDAAKFISYVKSMPTVPLFIGIDTLRLYMAGDENSSQDATAFLDQVNKAFPHSNVTLIHHTGVDPLAQGRPRGSSGWRGNMDMMKLIASSGDSIIKMRTTKTKDGDNSLEMCFKKRIVETGDLRKDGSPITTLVLDDASPEDADDAERSSVSDSQHFALQTFREAAETRGQLDGDGRFAGVALDDWREVFYSRSTGDNAASKRQAFKRARDSLIKNNHLQVENDIYRRAGNMAEFEESGYASKLKSLLNC